ncbi:hypothetical protein IWX90DRAFT_484980 [Phyllosticta citrichinensis]|uniref:Major facilitator superfamily (MFS) profile domain-containing protein n=1 Tax=Phyllosticta citrichinensis TaxID=1130410 RepID=A0ABR1Y0F5_9PEZI
MSPPFELQGWPSQPGNGAVHQSRFDDPGADIQVYIDNPLDGRTPEELEEDVIVFRDKYGLTDVINLELLQNGARIAQNPRLFEAIEGLTEEEKQALRDEQTKLWKQPRDLWLTIGCTSIAAALQGWDQTGSSGANLAWPGEMGVSFENDWLIGLVNAAPYVAAAVLGCWLSDPLNNYVGRRGTIFFATVFCFGSVIGAAFCQTWPQLFISRLLLGIGMGSKASTVPVYAAENAPSFFRGSFLCAWQFWVALGIFLGFSANLAVYQISDIGWRLQLGSAFIPAVPLLVLIWYAPESPRWYIKNKCYAAAYRSLKRLRNVEVQAARDFYYMHVQIEMEARVMAERGAPLENPHYRERTPVGRDLHKAGQYVRRFVQLFTIDRVRQATLAAHTVMIAQQMCGINIMAFYGASIFFTPESSTDYKSHDARTALLVSWGFGLVNFVFALPAVHRIDTLGRRTLLLVTFPGMALTLLGAAFCFKIPDDQSQLGAVTLFIFLFAAFYSPGEGPVPFTYCAEAFPLSHREVGMSFAVATNLFWAGILALVYPKMSSALTPTGALGLFAGLNVVAFVMIFLWVPETKQRTLEELNAIFEVPTRRHMRYQIMKTIPWLWRRYVLRKDVDKEPLYVFNREKGEAQREMASRREQQ